MADRPKPPEGFTMWLECCIEHVDYETSTYANNETRAYARAELDELRAGEAHKVMWVKGRCPICDARIFAKAAATVEDSAILPMKDDGADAPRPATP